MRVRPLPGRSDVFDGRVEPNVKHLTLELPFTNVIGNGDAPREIARDAAILQTFVKPLISNRSDERRPFVFLAIDPFAQSIREFRLLQEQMRTILDFDIR